jgi:hypothetical protein
MSTNEHIRSYKIVVRHHCALRTLESNGACSNLVELKERLEFLPSLLARAAETFRPDQHLRPQFRVASPAGS